MISLRRHIEAVRASDQEALAIAREEINRRLAGMNELREQINTERSQFLPLSTYNARHEDLNRRIGKLELWQANLTGRMVVFGVLTLIVVGTASALIAHILGG